MSCTPFLLLLQQLQQSPELNKATIRPSKTPIKLLYEEDTEESSIGVGLLKFSSKDDPLTFYGHGMPNITWTALQAAPAYDNPGQLRSYRNISDALKAKEARIKWPCPRKLHVAPSNTTLSLQHFRDECRQHFHEFGMEYIFFALAIDPLMGKSVMTSVLEHPERFHSPAKLLDYFFDILNKWGPLDRANDREAKQLIINGIDHELRESIRPFETKNEPAAVFLLRVCQRCQGANLDLLPRVREQMKALLPSQFVPYHITNFAAKYMVLARQLLDANQYEAGDILPLLSHLAAVPAATFAHVFRGQLVPARDVLRVALQMGSNYLAIHELKANNLHPQQICSTASSLYQALRDAGDYPPASSVKDSAAAPEMQTAELNAEEKLKKEIEELKQELQKLKHHQGTGTLKPTGDFWPAWKTTKTEETITKNNRKWFWCDHCRQSKGVYTPSHGTKDHKFPKEPKESTPTDSAIKPSNTTKPDEEVTLAAISDAGGIRPFWSD